jgi:hypothetical protein
LDRLKKLRANGDPDADRKLAEDIEAAITGRPLPSHSEELSPSDAEILDILDRRPTGDELRRRAYAKVLAGQPLDPEEEEAIVFGWP